MKTSQVDSNSKLQLNICHLYPDLMDTYGDRGNIIAVVKRCQWRGIDVTVSNISVGDSLSTSHFDFDFFFFGGGQDIQQEIVGKDLQKKAKDLKRAVEQESVILSICGGYQLLQNYFKTLDGKMIKGIGIFDAHTIGSTTRMIQNLLIKINPTIQSEISEAYTSLRGAEQRSNLKTEIKDSFASLRMTGEETILIGFENHSGKTFLGSNLKPLGKVIKGSGNNGEDGTEGAVYKNAFGCYLHGSLLPKNPHFADYLISKALERRYGEIKLEPLDDSIEWQAHKQAINRPQSQ
ncbi:MAG: glutamine amidotransferase [Candidatus Curtissbacteria bacterium]|nr:glutamine amidotransferase [Candidatus Curtissbacteria bacterium]